MSERPAFYSVPGLNVETYDTLTEAYAAEGSGTPIEGDLGFYLKRALRAGGPALELACGTGRIAWALAEAGVETVGLDRSGAMLDAARAKAERYAAAVRGRMTLLSGDMTDFHIDRRFRMVILAFRSFLSLLTPEAERACLERVREHLEPGGSLILDVFDPRLDWCAPGVGRVPREQDTVRHPVSGNKVRIEVTEGKTDPLTQIVEERWRFTELDPDGKALRREEETLKLRWIYRWELRHLLELAGFVVEEEYSGFQESPPVYAREIILIARPAG
ncbi:MAG: class I SAM-dependent methyltransferase [Candidatus Eisenbacteria bacterium]|nr:class I SAM-dependent methyltransferase [Candidatus Eisenbacteria bacterium]